MNCKCTGDYKTPSFSNLIGQGSNPGHRENKKTRLTDRLPDPELLLVERGQDGAFVQLLRHLVAVGGLPLHSCLRRHLVPET